MADLIAIHQRITDAERRRRVAEIDSHRAQAELAAAQGDEPRRRYHEAYAAAMSGVPGGHEEFMRIAKRRDAEDVIAGRYTLDHYASWERVTIRAEVERIQAEREAEADEALTAPRPSHGTAVPEFEASPAAASTAITNPGA